MPTPTHCDIKVPNPTCFGTKLPSGYLNIDLLAPDMKCVFYIIVFQLVYFFVFRHI